MYQIARNSHIDYLRKRKEEIPLDDQRNEAAAQELTPTEEMEKTEEIALLRKALSMLPLKKRQVLVLSRFQDFKYREIAELFGWHTGTVKEGLIHSLSKQTSPLVQVALIDLIVNMRERRAIDSLKQLIENEKFNPDVRRRAEQGLQKLSY